MTSFCFRSKQKPNQNNENKFKNPTSEWEPLRPSMTLQLPRRFITLPQFPYMLIIYTHHSRQHFFSSQLVRTQDIHNFTGHKSYIYSTHLPCPISQTDAKNVLVGVKECPLLQLDDTGRNVLINSHDIWATLNGRSHTARLSALQEGCGLFIYLFIIFLMSTHF